MNEINTHGDPVKDTLNKALEQVAPIVNFPSRVSSKASIDAMVSSLVWVAFAYAALGIFPGESPRVAALCWLGAWLFGVALSALRPSVFEMAFTPFQRWDRLHQTAETAMKKEIEREALQRERMKRHK